MRGRKKLLSLAALLSVLLIVPLVFSSGVVDVSKFLFESSTESSVAESSSSASSIFADPEAISDEALQSGSYFEVHVNISDVTDSFSWQINMSWNPSILNVSRIIPGEFLLRTISESKTAAYQLGYVINVTDNAEGYTAMGESILGGAPGINGAGRLITIEFLVVDYGSTDLTISVSGTLPTTLLNSTGNSMTFTTTDGYFSNKILGDVNGDRIVDGADFSLMGGAYRAEPGDPNWLDDADINRDGIVDGADFSIAGGNYRREI